MWDDIKHKYMYNILGAVLLFICKGISTLKLIDSFELLEVETTSKLLTPVQSTLS